MRNRPTVHFACRLTAHETHSTHPIPENEEKCDRWCVFQSVFLFLFLGSIEYSRAMCHTNGRINPETSGYCFDFVVFFSARIRKTKTSDIYWAVSSPGKQPRGLPRCFIYRYYQKKRQQNIKHQFVHVVIVRWNVSYALLKK